MNLTTDTIINLLDEVDPLTVTHCADRLAAAMISTT